MGESGLNGDEEDNSKAAVFVRFFFLYSSADKGPSPCLTRNTMRKRRLPPTPLRREMEISSRPAKRPRRASWTSSSVSTSTNGGGRAQEAEGEAGQEEGSLAWQGCHQGLGQHQGC